MTAPLLRQIAAGVAVLLFVVLLQVFINWRTRPPEPANVFPGPVHSSAS